jgi:hypothetical protein
MVYSKYLTGVAQTEPNRWFQDKKGTGAEVYCNGTRRKLSFSLG